jgi:hypothetical protein
MNPFCDCNNTVFKGNACEIGKNFPEIFIRKAIAGGLTTVSGGGGGGYLESNPGNLTLILTLVSVFGACVIACSGLVLFACKIFSDIYSF